MADADADQRRRASSLASPSPDRVLIDDDTPPSASYAGRGSAGRARIVVVAPDRIEIEADSELGGMLALHDTWYPGWIAEIDGERVPMLRADVLFRGVEVPAGRHRWCSASRRSGSTISRDALKLVLHGGVRRRDQADSMQGAITSTRRDVVSAKSIADLNLRF